MNKTSRRGFFKVCGSYLAALAAWHPTATNAAATPNYYSRALLMRNGIPMSSSDFLPGQVFVFNYPYVATPCMVFNLGKTVDQRVKLSTVDQDPYVWSGGAGPSQSIVAYSAICAHKMTYPAKNASFINYRHSKVVFFDEQRRRQEREKIIYCCSERSVYDPAKGAKVIGGPAPQPLASILIEYDSSEDNYYVVGTAGGEKFDEFLNSFEFRLQLDFKILDVRKPVSEKVELLTAEEYSHVIVHC
ncbi:MAG: hypothetical protein OXI60_03610 [Acidiferrobacterales bacterium]|nr:hypothetical protein [Acidiferrobacterales bacterium]